MKFIIKKSKAVKMLKPLGFSSHILLKSTHGKIVSSQVIHGKEKNPKRRSTVDFYRYAEYDSSYFEEISYDRYAVHMFKVDYTKLCNLINDARTKILQFEYPNPKTGGLKISTPSEDINRSSVEINLINHKIEDGENKGLPFKIDEGVLVFEDGARLDACVTIRKKEVERMLSPKYYDILRLIVNEDGVIFNLKSSSHADPVEARFYPEHVIKNFVSPVNNFYDVRTFLKVLKTLENNPTIYLAQGSPALIINNLRDYRVGFLIPSGVEYGESKD